MPKLSPLRMFGFGVKSQSSECNESVENPVQDGHGLRSKGVGIVPLSEKNVDGTPERRPLAPQNPKARLLKATREQPVDETRSDTSETRSEQSTPTRRHYSVQQVNKHGGASQFSTPRGTRIENRYTLMYSEPNNSAQVPTGTPKKSVRSLKYEQDAPVRAQGGGAVTTLGFPRGKHVESGAPVQFDLEEDLSFWQDHNVQVLIRVRPISEFEVSLQGPGRCLRQDSPHSLTWCGQPESRFTFDHVACETISQEKLFRVAGLPMVENCISGYNNCMFAYGQTGSGKTHTMLGDIADLDQEPSEGRGMIPRVFEYLFVKIELEKEARKAEGLQFVCKCSFLEIYNEQVSDLLEPSFTNLQLREDVKKGVYVENLTEVEVNSVQDVIKLLLQGSANRKVAATNMNRESSRSHSVFTCVVESKWETDSVINTRFGRLNLVDLAGSERQKSSGAEGDRLKEAANINKSLSTLGLVIMVLVDAANGKARHVPYRDSKLTFLLQDSLGGNSKTMIIATVSPSSSCALETLSTLKFAQRAKFIRNNAIVNEDSFGDVFSLRQQIHQLKEEISQLRNLELRKSRNDENDSVVVNHVSHDTLRDSMRREIAADSVIKNLREEITHLKRLVKQREDDTRRVKMLLRFREDRIRRMEATAVGSLTAAECNTEEKEALQEEVKLLGCRIEHNPEITRFAMENIRLMDELKRFQGFYDHGEREIMSTEISNLRDQLLEVLEENAALKDECGVSSHCTLISENEKLRLEVCQTHDLVGRLKDLQNENEELVRQNLELRAQMAATLEENGDHKREMELSVKSLKMDQDAHLSTIAGLKQLLQQSEETISCGAENSARLELQLSEAQRELEDLRAHMKDAKEVQEQMEYQQLLLINELESALLEKQEAVDDTRSVSVLKTQLQTLQLELQKKDEVRALEKQIESADNEEKLRLQGELVKTKQELDDAQELNRLFYREKVRRLSLEKRMDETRTQVEAETANTIASMQSELLLVNNEFLSAKEQFEEATTKAAKLADEIEALQVENARLTTVCEALNKDKDLEAQELHTVLQQACSGLLQHLSEGDRTLEAAVEQIEQASLSSQLIPKLGEQRSAVEVLQLILKQAFSIVKDAELKMQELNATALQMSEIQKQQEEEIQNAAERANGIECALELSERKAHAAFLVIRRCADVEHGLRTALASVNSEQQNALSALRAKLTAKSRALEFNLRDAWEELIVQDITSDAEVKRKLELGEEWTGRLAAAEAQLRHHLQQASGLEEELASTRLALEESLNKQMAGANEIFELKEDFSKLRLSADVERAAKSDLESKNAELALDLKREEDKRDMLEKDCLAALAEMNDLDIKVQQLDDHIGMLEEVNGSLKAENEALKHAIEDFKHDSEVMQTELREQLLLLEDEVGRKDAACQNLERSLLETKENADREAAELHEEISSRARAKEAEVLNLRRELSVAVTQANAMEMELRDLRELHASIVEENATLKSDIQDLECEFRSRENQMNETFDVMENMQLESDAELRKHKAIISALEGQILDLQDAAEAARAMETEQECKISHLREEISKKESVLKGLEFDMGVLQESFAAATAKKAEALECQSELQHQLTSRLNDLAHVEGLLNNLRKEVSESTDTLQLMEVERRDIKDQNAELSVQNISLKRKIEELELEKASLQGQFDDKVHLARMLELELFEVSSLVEQKIAESIAGLNNELNAVIKERDQLQADLLVSTEQLDMAQSLAEEREIVAAEARQIAEVSKARAEEKEEEIKVLERSVEELESIINALENQVGIIKREAQLHRMGREDLESEIQSLKREISVRQQMIEANSVAEETNVLLNEEVARLNEDCAEKEAQIQAYTKHLADLMSTSTMQASQFQQKINELETTIDQLKSKAKGSGSPFKCIGLGLSQQMSSELDEELSAARRRISELETVAAGRQREVFMLNAKLAEAESMTHDVVRDLLNVKVDISNYASLLSHEQAHQKASSSPGANEEIGRLNKQLEAYIEERDSCLEQMSQRQAELVAIRLASDKLRSREQALANENEKLKDDLKAFKKQQVDLESEIRKLSGQQNLQQRIHHHAKIKEENNTLKLKNEELSARLRHTETRLNRVSEELTRHRSAKGMPELDVEERLRSNLKEAEEDNMQMAQELANICKTVMQVAGVGSDTSIDPSVAIAALQKLDEQLTETQTQLADLNDKVAELERRE